MGKIYNNFKALLKKIYFESSILSILLNPAYFVRKGLWIGIKENSHYLHGKMLDFGCGSKPYKKLFNVTEYIGLDIEVSGHQHTNEVNIPVRGTSESGWLVPGNPGFGSDISDTLSG